MILLFNAVANVDDCDDEEAVLPILLFFGTFGDHCLVLLVLEVICQALYDVKLLNTLTF